MPLLSTLAVSDKLRAYGFCVLVLWLFTRWLSRRNRKHPPGPRGWPLVGNLFELQGNLWPKFTKWKQEYGPVVYISALGRPILVLNTHKAASDLLDRRAAIYSDRPRNIVANEITTNGLIIVFSGHTDVWRRMRRAAHEAVAKSVVPNYFNIQARESITLARALIKDAKAWEQHVRRATASAIMSIVYDMPPVESYNDPKLAHMKAFVHRLSEMSKPGAHLVEFLPWMKHLPSWLAGWKRKAEGYYRSDSVVFEKLYGDVQRRVESGDKRPSFVASLMKEQDRHGLDRNQASYLSATMFAGGADTSAVARSWFLHLMILHPDTQKKAQAELDSVVGRHRVPSFADFEDLPYMQALMKEIMRYRPVTPIGFPHAILEDDIYEGYFIPAGTIVLANIWAMNRDPDVYGPDAHEFNPDRYLDENGRLAPAPADTHEEGHVSFGFGRRVCVGKHLALNSLFIDMATVLWAAEITPATDVKGRSILPDTDRVSGDGIIAEPVPFECCIKPRFPEVAAIMAEAQERYDH